MPTTGTELIQAWGMPQDAWTEANVKVSRNIKGTERYELMHECTVGDFRMADVAGQFGPGRYKVAAGAGPYGGKETTFTISPEYANRNGYGSAPASASEMMALRTLQDAQRGPVDPLQLAQLIETAVAKAVKGRQEEERPSSGMEALALIMKGFEMAGTMQSRALDTVRMMGGLPALGKVDHTEAKERNIWDALMEIGPDILKTVQMAMVPIRPGMTATPENVQSQRKADPKIVEDVQPQPAEGIPMPDLTPEESDAIAPIVGMMAPYAAKLLPYIKGGVPADRLGNQLLGYVGPGLYDSILALDAVCRAKGCGVLRAIHPELAVDHAAAVVASMAGEIRAMGEEV